MQQTNPQFLDEVSPEEIVPVLGITTTRFTANLPPQIVSTGLRDLLVGVDGKGALAAIQPDFDKIVALSGKYDVTGIHAFTLADECTAIARNFAPRVGINEESATGTSNGALLCYLRKRRQLKDEQVYRIEQGENMGQPSSILGKFIDERIWVGGKATLLSERTVESWNWLTIHEG